MMKATTIRTQNFATDQTTPLVRMNALVMAIMHIPTMIGGFLGVMFSFMFWPVLPVSVIAFMTGFYLYSKYWAMYWDRITRDDAHKAWKRTYYFNIILLIPAFWANIVIGLTWGWFIVGFIVTSIFLAKTALNELAQIQPNA